MPVGESSVSLNDAAFGEDYYRTVYRHYERQNPSYKTEFYRQFILQHAGRDVGRILDVGCAFGGFLASLPKSWDRYGIDISSFAIEQAARTNPDLHVANAILENNPFKGPFDVVTSFDVIEHINDLEKVAACVADLLTPGGLYVFVVPTYDGPFGPVVHFLDHDPTHLHKTNRRFWLEWAARHFEIQEWIGAFRFLAPVGPYIHWPTRALRSISPAIMVAARTRTTGGRP